MFDLICPTCDFEFEFTPCEDLEECPTCGHSLIVDETYDSWEITWYE